MRTRGPDEWSLVERTATRSGAPLHRRAGLELVAAASAPKFLDACEADGIRVVGIEAFIVDDDRVRPDMSRIADFSSLADPAESVSEARRFIEQTWSADEMLDFTLKP